MTHDIFIKNLRDLHNIALKRINRVVAAQLAETKEVGGVQMSGGAYGELYEKIYLSVALSKKLRVVSSPHGAVTDIYFDDYRSILQIKTNQGGAESLTYTAGKTKYTTRGEAVSEYREKVMEQFIDVYPSAENFYMLSYNAKDDYLDFFHLAERDGKRVSIVDNFIHKSPRGYDPSAPVRTQLKFAQSVLRRLARFP
jgi:hypothetical protein